MQNTLIISDTHFPYHHPDTFAFLKAIKKHYKIQQVKHTGDAVDNHSSSFHEVEYGTMSAKEEHDAAKSCIQELNKIFPKLTMIIGNHGSMSTRKAKSAGIPIDHIKSYNHMYDIKGWTWTDKDYFKINKNENCLLIHSMSTNTLNNAAKHSFNSVQGHHHSKFGIEYFGDCEMLRWSMTCGCLINPNEPAFNYAAGATLNRPVIGCGAIIEDHPVLIPMRLNHKGRWNGKL